jgi:hypothetical protein
VGVVVAPKSNHPFGAHILAREMIWVGPEKVFGFCFVCGHEKCVARDFFCDDYWGGGISSKPSSEWCVTLCFMGFGWWWRGRFYCPLRGFVEEMLSLCYAHFKLLLIK